MCVWLCVRVRVCVFVCVCVCLPDYRMQAAGGLLARRSESGSWRLDMASTLLSLNKGKSCPKEPKSSGLDVMMAAAATGGASAGAPSSKASKFSLSGLFSKKSSKSDAGGGAHDFVKGVCMVCRGCGSCTGYVSPCRLVYH